MPLTDDPAVGSGCRPGSETVPDRPLLRRIPLASEASILGGATAQVADERRSFGPGELDALRAHLAQRGFAFDGLGDRSPAVGRWVLVEDGELVELLESCFGFVSGARGRSPTTAPGVIDDQCSTRAGPGGQMALGVATKACIPPTLPVRSASVPAPLAARAASRPARQISADHSADHSAGWRPLPGKAHSAALACREQSAQRSRPGVRRPTPARCRPDKRRSCDDGRTRGVAGSLLPRFVRCVGQIAVPTALSPSGGV